jgi:hypothetical protein
VSNGITPQDTHRERTEVITEGVKGLFVMNGGGAVALLAFLQAIWKDQPALANFVLRGIAIMALGLFLAGFVNLFRYLASFKSNRYTWFRNLALSLQCLSLIAFLVAVAVVIFGARSLLPI